MLTINLRRANGNELPCELQIRPKGIDYLEFKVVDRDSQQTLSCETFHRDLVPLYRNHPDLEGISMVIGSMPEENVMLFEFGGKDARLAMAGLGEVRSAVNVASYSTQNLVAA